MDSREGAPWLGPLTRRQALRGAGVASAGLLLPNLLAACSDDDDGSSDKSTGRVISSLSLAVDWPGGGPPLDVTRGPATDYLYYTLSASLQGLLFLDQKAKLAPSLAESWSNPDPLTYTFNVRDGVTFWDGTPLELEDIVYSFERHQEKRWESNWSYAFPTFKSIDVDKAKRTITFNLEKPYVYFAGIAGIVPSYVVPRAFAAQHVKDIGTPSVLTMGTGPLKIESYVPDDRAELVRNKGYWGPAAPIDKLTLRAIPDENARLLALQSGEIDGSLAVPPLQAEEWGAIPGVKLISYPTAASWWAALDREVKPLDDIHVRKALALALDRPGLIKAAFKDRARLASTMEPPETWRNLLPAAEVEDFYKTLPQNEFDLDAAKAELAQSSVPDGFTLDVPVETNPVSEKVMQVWKQGAAEIGITLNLKSVSTDQYTDMYYNRTKPVPIGLAMWGTEYPDPMWNLDFLLPSENATAGSFNLSNLKDPKLDALLEQHKSDPEPASRAKVVKEIVSLVAEDHGFYFLFWPDQVVACKDDKATIDRFSWWARTSSVWPSYFTAPA
jgi:peptide/nickel transport system substrate-binding protein